ncbi:hypothetical protein PRJ39_09885 [Lysobacter enzymogenes]|uniref:hypothetical protein n=1 Tax=Lysobacter enzymogenes TaxID=69 RepID=UPI00374A7B68
MQALKKMRRRASESAATKFTVPEEIFSREKSARASPPTPARAKTPANPGPHEYR